MNEYRVFGTALRWVGNFNRVFSVLAAIQTVIAWNFKPAEVHSWYWTAVATGLAYHGFTWVGNYVEEKGLGIVR